LNVEQKLASVPNQFSIGSIPLLKELEAEMHGRQFRKWRHKWGIPFIQPSTFRKFFDDEAIQTYLKGEGAVSLCTPLCSVNVNRFCYSCNAIRVSRYVLQRTAIRNCLHWEEEYSRVEYTYHQRRENYQPHPLTLLFAHPFRCPICGTLYKFIRDAEDCKRKHIIKKNFDLAKKLMGLKPRWGHPNAGRVYIKRLKFTIYRLYRLDVSPKIIANELKIRERKVREWIGEVFAAQCLKSDACAFRDVLSSVWKTMKNQH
jgi:hypothetical protein